MRRKRIDDIMNETPQEEMDICLECPFSSCKKGDCDYFAKAKKIITPPRNRTVCGDCKHYIPGETKRSGTCAVRKYVQDRKNGFVIINQQKVPFLVYYAKTACKKFESKE